MAWRNILVAFNGSDSSINALRYAAKLCVPNGHLTAMLAHARHEAVDTSGAWVPQRARAIIQKAQTDLIEGIEARFAEVAGELAMDGKLHFKKVSGRVDAVLSESARGFDLLVAGRGEATDDHLSLHPGRIALMSGRPVLIVPGACQAISACDHIAVAWDGGRAAARALSDSLGLLRGDGRVSILTVGSGHLPRPIDDVLTHLKRHGIDVAHNVLSGSAGVAKALLDYCALQDPCLLVMGAYEHSKFREDFFGGVTAEVLPAAPVPVLLSH